MYVELLVHTWRTLSDQKEFPSIPVMLHKHAALILRHHKYCEIFLDWLCSFPWQHTQKISLTFCFVVNKSQTNLSHVKTSGFFVGWLVGFFKYYFWNRDLWLESLGSLRTWHFFVGFLWGMFLLFFFKGYSSLLKLWASGLVELLWVWS